jgi:2-methylcitrate dehydratase
MPALQSGAPPPKSPQKYDPEITDMASYIHNYKIDSELAVRLPFHT